MKTLPLKLRRCREPLPERAWLLPLQAGACEEGRWLDAFCALGVPLLDLQLYPIPAGAGGDRAAGERRPAALLVVPREPLPPRPRHSRLLPLARLGQRLFVPVDARPSPPVTEAELDAALPLPVNLLHPVHGLVGFEAHDALRVSDLLVPPPTSASEWDAADAGVAGPPPLLAVELAAEPRLDELLQEGRGDIGTAPPAQLPAHPNEPFGRRVVRALRALLSPRLWLARRARSVAARVPATSTRRTWVNRLEDWADRVLAREVLEERRSEIARLMHLLQQDPDRGLRFALPLHGPGDRGVAPPGVRLQQRAADYDSRRLAGGAAIDVWNLDRKTRRELGLRYRELARRELDLGRARRAAYILAELLGDERAAAQALQQGGHFREAAQLFGERLGDRPAAARCLERGGLLTEALALYRELGDLRRVAALLRVLERHDEADATWRGVVEYELRRGERIAAARVLEQELGSGDEALAVLAAGWPQDPNAEACLHRQFALLQRLGRHRAARAWIERHAETGAPAGVAAALARVLARVAREHVDSELRTLAADRARVLIGAQLAAGSHASDALLFALAAVDPADVLLARDVARARAQMSAPARTRAHPRPRAGHARPRVRLELVREFRIPAVEASTVVAGGATGLWHFDCRRPELVRFDWHGRATSRWRWPENPGARSGLLLPVEGPPAARVCLALIGAVPRLDGRELMHGDQVWWAGTPDGVHAARGMCRIPTGGIWVLDVAPNEQRPLLQAFGSEGPPLRTIVLDAAPPSEPMPMAATPGHVWLGGASLARVRPNGDVEAIAETADTAVHDVVVSPPGTRQRLLAACMQGCFLVGDCDAGAPRTQRFAAHMLQPCVTFTRGGVIAAAGPEGVALAITSDGAVVEVLRDERAFECPPVAVLPTAHPYELVVVAADGHARRLRVVGL